MSPYLYDLTLTIRSFIYMPTYGSRFRLRRTARPAPLSGTQPQIGTMRVYYSGVESPTEKTVVRYQSQHADHAPKTERTWDQKNPGPPFLSGGPFLNTKFVNPLWDIVSAGTYVTDPAQIGGAPFKSLRYEGGFTHPTFPGDPTSSLLYTSHGLPGQSSVMIPDVSTLGPSAYNKLKPQLEQAGAAQFLAEMRDVPRMLKQTSAFFHDAWKSAGGSGQQPFMSPKRASKDFLNVQFGWMPFISDMRKLSSAYNMSKEHIARITRNNDRWIKRSRVISDLTSTTFLSAANNVSAFHPVLGETIGKMMALRPGIGGVPARSYTSVMSEDFTHIWSEGKFKYYRPEFDSSLPDYESGYNAARRQMTLYGANINPSVLYKITPWSWLVDWFSNVGDNIDNANSWANDGSVAKYLYVMAHSTRVITQTTVFHYWEGKDVTCKWIRNFESKQRVEAGPYGLGWSQGSLSPRQLAILGALAISRLP